MHNKPKDRLWTRNFLLLWQGQLVSTMGDAAYAVALGFWVLQVTGSTALMGALEATSTLPGVLLSPFAGVLVDRTNKKALMIAMDILRGLGVILVSAAAFTNHIEVWMVFAAGVLLSLCGAVFRPGSNSCVPDLVPKSKLDGANSMLASVSTGSNMIGNVAGGFLFQLFGAPLLFLFNGLSYFFSGASLSFAKIPRSKSVNDQNFFADFKDGFRYVKGQAGLTALLILCAFVNFFSFVAIIDFMPLFQKSPNLGPGLYGVAMASFMGGCMLGYLLMTVIKIPSSKRVAAFFIADFLTSIFFIICVNLPFFGMMIPFAVLGGMLNSVINVIFSSSVMISTPNEMRGKVMSIIGMVTQGLTPFAMVLGGVLAAVLPVRLVISCSFGIVVLVSLPFFFMKAFREYISYETESPAEETVLAKPGTVTE